MFVCQAQHTIIKLRFYSSSSNKGIQTSAILARPHSPPPMPEEQGTELFTWGQGVLGQLGHGDEKPQNQPRLIVSFLGTNVKAVSCGEWRGILIRKRKLRPVESRLLAGQQLAPSRPHPARLPRHIACCARAVTEVHPAAGCQCQQPHCCRGPAGQVHRLHRVRVAPHRRSPILPRTKPQTSMY